MKPMKSENANDQKAAQNKKLSRLRDGLVVLFVLAATLILDQATKNWAKASLRSHDAIEYANGMFRLEYAENPGAFLGLGGGMSADLRFWIFTVLVALFLVFAAATLFRLQSDRFQQLGLALLVGGGLGNLWDRLLYQRVVDFMNMGLGELRTGIFNFADFAIVVGICLMVFGQYFPVKNPKAVKSA